MQKKNKQGSKTSTPISWVMEEDNVMIMLEEDKSLDWKDMFGWDLVGIHTIEISASTSCHG